MATDSQAMTKTILKNFTLLDVEAGRSLTGRSILIDDGKISRIAVEPLTEDGATVVDLGGRTLMPGLIDCHVHVTAVRLDIAPTRYMPVSLVTAGASRIMRGMLNRGFTTVRDAGGADRGLKLAVEQGLFQGPRLFVCGRTLSQTGGHGDLRPQVDQPVPDGLAHLFDGIGRIADGVAEVQRAARDEIRLGADHIKIMASGGVISMADPIDVLQYSEAELRAAADEARRAQTYVMAHAYTAPAIARCVEAGIRSIEHGNLIDTRTADLMAENEAFLVPTLTVYEALAQEGAALGLSPLGIEKLQKINEAGAHSLEIARAAGVRMAYGSDLLGDLHRHQSNEFRLRSGSLSAADIIRAATVNGAELVGMAGRLGIIAEGAFADLLVVDGDPLADVTLLGEPERNVRAIIKDGVFIKNEI